MKKKHVLFLKWGCNRRELTVRVKTLGPPMLHTMQEKLGSFMIRFQHYYVLQLSTKFKVLPSLPLEGATVWRSWWGIINQFSEKWGEKEQKKLKQNQMKTHRWRHTWWLLWGSGGAGIVSGAGRRSPSAGRAGSRSGCRPPCCPERRTLPSSPGVANMDVMINTFLFLCSRRLN